MHTLAPELLQVPDPQTPHEEAALAPVVATNDPAKQEVQPPVSLDVPAEVLYFPITHAFANQMRKFKEGKNLRC